MVVLRGLKELSGSELFFAALVAVLAVKALVSVAIVIAWL